MICWLQDAKYSSYTYTWTFPTAFSSTNYSVQVTHVSNQSTDQTTKVHSRSKANCVIRGNQDNMNVTAIAIGY